MSKLTIAAVTVGVGGAGSTALVGAHSMGLFGNSEGKGNSTAVGALGKAEDTAKLDATNNMSKGYFSELDLNF